MERRYDDMLTARLESVDDDGCAYITWNTLYRWYGVEKIAAGTYRDLEKRWQDISGGKQGKLMQVAREEGVFLFAQKRIKPISPD